MVTNIDLILSSILTANIIVASIITFPNNIISLLAIIVSMVLLVLRNKEDNFNNERLKGV